MVLTINRLTKLLYTMRLVDWEAYLKLHIELTKSIWIISDELYQMFSCGQIDITEVKFHLPHCQIHLIKGIHNKTDVNQAPDE